MFVHDPRRIFIKVDIKGVKERIPLQSFRVLVEKDLMAAGGATSNKEKPNKKYGPVRLSKEER